MELEDINSKANPQFPTSLPGSFWGITTFFNPCQYRNKYANYRIFRQNASRQGLNLLAVELAFDDDPFELKDHQDAQILIQLRGTREKNLMWQKERLLNLGLKHLPADCDKVAWIDCDVLFKNDSWIKETSGLLEKYIVVQPFELSIRLAKDAYDISSEDIKKLPYGEEEGQKLYSTGYQFSVNGRLSQLGFCWALRRSVAEKHLFYDSMILGSADTLAALAYFGIDPVNWGSNHHAVFVPLDYSVWAKRIYSDIKGSVYFTQGVLLHLWHGEAKNRIWKYRLRVFSLFYFNPALDIKIGLNGLWEWSSDKPQLHRIVAEFFGLRNEEGEKITFAAILLDQLAILNIELKATQARINYIESSPTYKFACFFKQIGYFILPSLKIRLWIISGVRFIGKAIAKPYGFIVQRFKKQKG